MAVPCRLPHALSGCWAVLAQQHLTGGVLLIHEQDMYSMACKPWREGTGRQAAPLQPPSSPPPAPLRLIEPVPVLAAMCQSLFNWGVTLKA